MIIYLCDDSSNLNLRYYYVVLQPAAEDHSIQIHLYPVPVVQ